MFEFVAQNSKPLAYLSIGSSTEVYIVPCFAGAFVFFMIAVVADDSDQKKGLKLFSIGLLILSIASWYNNNKWQDTRFRTLSLFSDHLTITVPNPIIKPLNIPYENLRAVRYFSGTDRAKICVIKLILKTELELHSVKFFHEGRKNCEEIHREVKRKL